MAFASRMSNGSRRFFGSATGKLNDVYIVSCARTPLGSFQGSLSKLSAPKLGSLAITQAVERAKIERQSVQEVYMGCVLQGGVGQAPARQAALGAGLANSTPCTTVNKVCASGMKSIMLAASSLALGIKDCVVAGGMESLSNSPFYLKRGASASYGTQTMRDSCDFDALTDPYSGWHMGDCAENMVRKLDINREDQDNYAKESYRRYNQAKDNGVYDKEIFEVEGVLSHDEESTAHDIGMLLSLPTKWGPTITPGSSAKLADGAAACVLMTEEAMKRCNVEPLARIVNFEDAAQDPVDWPTSPALGIAQLLKRLELDAQRDVDVWEINEAFAMVVLANQRLLDLDPDTVNVNGGAIAIGHPFGMSGARITNHLALNLNKGQVGVASLCNGGGGASTIILEGV